MKQLSVALQLFLDNWGGNYSLPQRGLQSPVHGCSALVISCHFVGCTGEFASQLWKGEFRMVCGQSAPSYSWYKDGIPLNSSSYLTEEKERIVAVTNETRNPFGLYTCNTSGVIRQWYLPELASGGTVILLCIGSD